MSVIGGLEKSVVTGHVAKLLLLMDHGPSIEVNVLQGFGNVHLLESSARKCDPVRHNIVTLRSLVVDLDNVFHGLCRARNLGSE